MVLDKLTKDDFKNSTPLSSREGEGRGGGGASPLMAKGTDFLG